MPAVISNSLQTSHYLHLSTETDFTYNNFVYEKHKILRIPANLEYKLHVQQQPLKAVHPGQQCK